MKYLSYLITLVVVICSCNDSLDIGNSLLADEQVDVFVDTITIEAQTVRGDSILTFALQDQNNFINNVYMVGQISDSQFGSSEATAFFSPSLLEEVPDLDQYSIDSVVMVLILDTLGRYGDPSAIHELELYELTESIVPDSIGATLISTDELDFESTPLLTQSLAINYDSLTIQVSRNDSIIDELVQPQLRFLMDTQMWTDYLTSNGDIDNDVLAETLPGYALRSNVTNSMLGLNLRFGASTSEIVFYLSENDSTKREYILDLGRLRHNNFVHDYTGSDVEEALADSDSEFLFLESQGGTDIDLDLRAIKDIGENVVLNNATLEFAVVPGANTEFYPSPGAIFASFVNDNGISTTVVDIVLNDRAVTLEERGGVEFYTMDITSQLNLILDDDINSSIIKVFTNAKAQRPNRAVICGPDHPEFPLTLRVVLTNP